MSIVFACATSHTPGIRAWADAPPVEQKERFYAGSAQLGEQLRNARPDAILIISSEHFANYFLDGMPAFTIGQGESHFGPLEPWLKVDQGKHTRRARARVSTAERLFRRRLRAQLLA